MESNDSDGEGMNTTTTDSPPAVLGEEKLVWPYAYARPSSSTFVNQIIITKTISLLSMIGSGYIIYKLVFDVKDAADRRKKINRTFDRMLLCLSVSDSLTSMALFLGSW